MEKNGHFSEGWGRTGVGGRKVREGGEGGATLSVRITVLPRSHKQSELGGVLH